MNAAYWSWLLTAVGVTGFVLAGRRVWWAWYVNLGCQALWLTYAIATNQYGFIVAAAVYTVVFTRNAIAWTRDRHALPITTAPDPELDTPAEPPPMCGRHTVKGPCTLRRGTGSAPVSLSRHLVMSGDRLAPGLAARRPTRPAMSAPWLRAPGSRSPDARQPHWRLPPRLGASPVTEGFLCLSDTGPGPCRNPVPHAMPRGCVHWSTSGVPDRHELGDDE